MNKMLVISMMIPAVTLLWKIVIMQFGNMLNYENDLSGLSCVDEFIVLSHTEILVLSHKEFIVRNQGGMIACRMMTAHISIIARINTQKEVTLEAVTNNQVEAVTNNRDEAVKISQNKLEARGNP